jgi:two-component system, LuxR family, response regulator FixJ
MADPIHVALIDDDEAMLDALQLYFARNRVKTTCFQSAEKFLNEKDHCEPLDCIVTDVRMPGMSGIDLVHHLINAGSSRPIILISGHGDIEMAVSAVKCGAFDFIEKPFDEGRLLAIIREAVEETRQKMSDAVGLEDLLARFQLLSARQRQIMNLAAAGLSSKEISVKLHISRKTVENHRAWVMSRMGARNVAELVRLAMRIEKRV